MEPDDPPETDLDQRQLDDLAALRAAAARRRGLVPGTDAHQAALAEERTIARRIRAWASRRPGGAGATGDGEPGKGSG